MFDTMGKVEAYEQVRVQRVAESKAEGEHYRAMSEDQDREVNPNWWIIEEPEIASVVRQASKRVLSQFGERFDSEDLESDAWVAASRIADRAKACLAGEDGLTMGTFQHELEMDLLNMYGPIYGRHGKTFAHDPGTDGYLEFAEGRSDSRHTHGHSLDDEATEGRSPQRSAWGHDFRGGSGEV